MVLCGVVWWVVQHRLYGPRAQLPVCSSRVRSHCGVISSSPSRWSVFVRARATVIASSPPVSARDNAVAALPGAEQDQHNPIYFFPLPKWNNLTETTLTAGIHGTGRINHSQKTAIIKKKKKIGSEVFHLTPPPCQLCTGGILTTMSSYRWVPGAGWGG